MRCGWSGSQQAFAAWYLRPRTGGGQVPACWRAAFDVADDSHLMIVQHLLLGVNAHVNHDLPQVVVELAPERGDLAGLRADYDAVNDILAETLPEVLRSLGAVSRWVNPFGRAGGERLFDFSWGWHVGKPGTPPSGCELRAENVGPRWPSSTVSSPCSPTSSRSPGARCPGR